MDKQTQIIGYWAMAMLNYRQPKGDAALDKLREITDHDTCAAIMFISGFAQGMGLKESSSTEGLKRLAKPVEDQF